MGNIYLSLSLSLSIEIFQEKRRNFIDQLYLESVEERLKEKEKKKSQFSNDPSSIKKKRKANVSENVS